MSGWGNLAEKVGIEEMSLQQLDELEKAIQEKKSRIMLDPNKLYIIIYRNDAGYAGDTQDGLYGEACAEFIKTGCKDKCDFDVYEQVLVARYRLGYQEK